MKTKIKNLLVFVCICSAIALLLAGTNFLTAPIIEKNQNAAANDALLEVMPNGAGFKEIDLSSYTLPATVTKAHRETDGHGYVIELKTTGYGSDMIIMCGVSENGTVTGAVCLSSNETLGAEKAYGDNFKDKDSAGVEAVDTVANATLTTKAYKNAVKDALNAALVFGGGEADLRTEEEIFADNLAAALPSGEGKFEKAFTLIDLAELGADEIYAAENGSGYVFIVGKTFIGVKADGTVLTEGVENANAFADAAKKIANTSFEDVNLSEYTLPASVTKAEREKNGLGYIITLKTEGYAPDMIIVCTIKANGTVMSAVCTSSNETMNKEKTYGDSFIGKDAAGVEAVDTIVGSTATTTAYKNAVKDALNAAIILGGGSVDVRTEEEILADNLAAALPFGEGKFEKVFLTEEISGFDAIYKAENGAGYVFVIGEQFIGAKADGTVLTEGAQNAAVTEAVLKIEGSVLEKIDFEAYEDLQKILVSAHKTASGNYVFETKGAGYGINGGNEWHPSSGMYIIVRVSMTEDGKIIDCLTVSQEETKNLGDACAKEEFYGQFDGKTEENYQEIDGIAGATMTTDGYIQAITRAYTALNTLKGGAQPNE